MPDLNIIARRIKGHLEVSIEIASYTDAIGDESSNLDLSQKRADAIVSYLIRRGIRESKTQLRDMANPPLQIAVWMGLKTVQMPNTKRTEGQKYA